MFVKLINNRIPHACIGVDVIVGFPGETDEHFNQTLSFLKELNISYLHVFHIQKRKYRSNKYAKPNTCRNKKI